MNDSLRRVAAGLTLAGFALASALPAVAQEKVEDRLARVERILASGALTDLVNGQGELRQSARDLQGEVELLRRDLDELRQRQRELYVDTDRRLRQLETAAPAVPASPPVDSTPPADATDGQPPAAALDSAASATNELGAYQAAFDLLKAGRYAPAAQAFESFLERYPKGEYTANALYWLGESYYVVRDFERARPYFQRVVEEHPGSGKQPDALLKIGFIHAEQGDTVKARSILEKLKTDYPNSSAAALAEQRLLKIAR